MMSGIPVISTKNGGVEDAINEDTGVLVNIGDFESIAKILNLMINKKLRFDAQKIRNHIISQCGSKVFVQKMTEFYNIN